LAGVDGQGQPLHWALNLVGGASQASVVQSVLTNAVTYQYDGASYQLKVAPDAGTCQQLSNGDIQLSPDNSGKLVLVLDVAR
jgi:hypothetical protein